MEEHLTEYERERAARVAANKRQMELFGLSDAVAQVAATAKPARVRAPVVKRERPTKDGPRTAPTRVSLRGAGIKPDLPEYLQHLNGNKCV